MNLSKWYGTLTIAMAGLLVATLAVPGVAFLMPANSMVGSDWHFVVRLESVPDDGVPRQYLVFAGPIEPELRGEKQAIGRIFLLREPGSANVKAFHIHCRRGASITFNAETNLFESTCWAVSFNLDGSVHSENSNGFSEEMIAVPVKVERGRLLAKHN